MQKNSKWLMASWSPAHSSVLFAVDPTKVGGERKTRLVDEIVETTESRRRPKYVQFTKVELHNRSLSP